MGVVPANNRIETKEPLPDLTRIIAKSYSKLLRSVGHFARGQLVLRYRQSLLGRPIPVILASFNVLVFFEGKEEFTRGEVVLVTRGQPQSRRHFGLFERENSPAVQLSENASAKRNVAQQVSFRAHHLVRLPIHPYFRHHMGNRF